MDAGERELAFKRTLPKMAAWQGDRTTAERVNSGGETASMMAFLCYRLDPFGSLSVNDLFPEDCFPVHT